MGVEKVKIIVRNGKKTDLNGDILQIGEPAFLTDTGELIIKKSDGTLAVFKQLEKEDITSDYLSDKAVTAEKLSDELYEFINSLDNDIKSIDEREYFNGCYINEDSQLQFTCDGMDVGDPINVATGTGGGGGGGSSTSVVKLVFVGSSTKYVAAGQSCTITYDFLSTIDGTETGNGTAEYSVNGVLKATKEIAQGNVSFDCTDYLNVGTNKVTVKVTDSYGNYRTLRWTINNVSLTIESTFDSSVPIIDSDINIKYLVVGDGDKQVHFVVDGNEVSVSSAPISNRQYSQNINQLPHGCHILEMYAETTVNETTIKSNVIRYALICLNSGSSIPVIACNFNANTANQGDLLTFNYIVYDPSKLKSHITLTVNETTVQTLDVDRTMQTWAVKDYPSGIVKFGINYGDIKKEFTVTVGAYQKPCEASDTGLILFLNSAGRSNSESNPDVWKNNGISTSFSNFNHSTNGWIIDDDGDTALRCNNKAQAVINIKPFENDCRDKGKVIELEFAARNVLNYDVPIISCKSETGVGFEVYPNKFIFSSSQTSVFANFKEEEKIRIALVIQDKAQDRLISTYLNGVCCGVTQYPTNDDFSQPTPVPITIGSGSPLCGVDFYICRIYENDLNMYEILYNYIADRTRTDEISALWDKNNIVDSYGNLIYDNVLARIPCFTVIGDLPTFKGDKKTVSLVYENGQDNARSFTAENVQIDVQGTSSATLFRKNFKWKLKSGCDMTSTGEHLSKYQLTADSIAEGTYCMKANYMESGNYHNTEMARFIPTLMPQLPQQDNDSRIRATILGFPCIMWHRTTPDSELEFIGIYDFNNDKSDVETFGCSSEYPDAQIVEFCNNTSMSCQFLSDEYAAEDFEFRHPDGGTDFTEFDKLLQWVVGWDLSSYEGDELKEKINQFRQEAPQHIDVDACLAYWLYTDVFAMVDSRAKNFFPGTSDFVNDVWRPYPYDMDTCFGLNNEGVISFDYFIEVHDKLGDANCYNGEASRLWNDLEIAYASEIKSLYQKWRSTGKLGYEVVIDSFYKNSISKLSAALYNLDGMYKYLVPLQINNDGSKLFCWQGDRYERLKWWWYNRVRYKDGQYEAGDYMANYIQMRLYTPTSNNLVVPTNFDFDIYSYLAGYIKVKFGSKVNGIRQETANLTTHISAPADTFNDTECIVYGYGIMDIGDLAPKYVGTVDVSMATSLKTLKIGDTSEGYKNTNLRVLSLGANTLLTTINIANCPNLSDTLDVSGCINIEEILATGTTLTAVKFPTGGNLKRVFLPATVSNLTICGHSDITELSIEGYDNISTLRLEEFPLNICSILHKCTSLYRVRLVDVNITDTDLSVLETIRMNCIGLDENDNNISHAVITGQFHVNGTIKRSDIVMFEDEFNGLNITADTIIDDVLYDKNDNVVVDKNNNVVVLPNDTSYKVNYSAEELDTFIDDVDEAMKKIEEGETINE